MSYTDIKLNGTSVTQIALADGTILWKKDVEPTEWSGLTLTNTSDEDGTLSVLVGSSVTSVPNLEYSSNGSTWTTATLTAGETTEIPVASGKSIMLRGTNTSGFNGSKYTTFNLDKAHTASGNLMSLVDYTNMDTLTEVPSYSFNSLFYEDANLTSVADLTLGEVVTINDYGLNALFKGCTALTDSFDMSKITTIGECGISYLYRNCSAMAVTPDMSNITSIGMFACQAMFEGTAITEGADLSNVETLEYYALGGMYYYCTQLITPTNIPKITTLPSVSLYDMYDGCTALTTPMDLSNVTTIGSSGCWKMYKGCTNLVYPSDLSNVTSVGNNGCMNMYEGCTSLINGSNLQSTTSLGTSALSYMYNGCTSLILGSDIRNVTTVGTTACTYMYQNCSKLQTVFAPKITSWTTSKFTSWVSGAGSSASTPKTMYYIKASSVPTTVGSLSIPSGVNGYGVYTTATIVATTKIVTLTTSEYTYATTYQIDDADAVSVDENTTATITLTSSNTSLILDSMNGLDGAFYNNGTEIGGIEDRPLTIAVSDLKTDDYLYCNIQK